MKQIINSIANDFSDMGISCYYVGGCVRDSLLGIPSEDIDICLIGVTDKSQVMEVLGKHASKVAQEVGETFPVWIATVGGQKVDFALGRAEKRTGDTRKDFSILIEGVTLEEDLRRRDLTINAIAQCCLTGEIKDPFGGQRDLHSRVARAVSSAFSEDPLRVYRLARFCARFELAPTWDTICLCRNIAHVGISPERVGMELHKMFEQAKTPSVFFEVLQTIGWLKYHFPQVEALIGLEQNPEYHPEITVWNHTMACMDQAKSPFIRCVMLCHDFGKVTTTERNPNGKITSIGHELAGVPMTVDMLTSIKFCDNRTLKQICCLVELHMLHTKQISRKLIKKTLRKLLSVGLDYDTLVEVCRCDVSGRPPIEGYTPDIGQKIAIEIMAQNELVPIVTGDILLELGFSQSKEFGDVMRKALELQDRGSLNQDNWLKILNGTNEFKTLKKLNIF